MFSDLPTKFQYPTTIWNRRVARQSEQGRVFLCFPTRRITPRNASVPGGRVPREADADPELQMQYILLLVNLLCVGVCFGSEGGMAHNFFLCHPIKLIP